MAADFARRFEELSVQAEKIGSNRKPVRIPGTDVIYRVEQDELLNWIVKVRHLIETVCGQESHHIKLFLEAEKGGLYVSSHEVFKNLRAVFLAAKDDYEGGYLNKVRHLIQAEVFDNELEQAVELLSSGYLTAAAVVAGVVLETSLRQLCIDNKVPTGKLDKMNADLAKTGIYNNLVQKQITAYAAIRNSAAHGKSSEFVKNDVTNMIQGVQNFLAARLI